MTDFKTLLRAWQVFSKSRHSISLAVLVGLAIFCTFGAPGVFSLKSDPIQNVDEETAVLPVFAKIDTVDLGAVLPGNLINASFELVNDGSESVFIKLVTTDCGCAKAGPHESVIPAHQSLSIPIVFDPVGAGRFDFVRNIVVTVYREEVSKNISLTLKGKVNHAHRFVATPGLVNFGDVISGNETIKSIVLHSDNSILNAVPSAIELLVNSPGPSITNVPIILDHLEGKRRDGQKAIQVKVAVDQRHLGAQTGQIRFQVTGVPVGSLTIPWKANVVAPITASVRRIILKVGSPQSVVVKTSHGVKLTGVNATCDLPTVISFRQGASDNSVSIMIAKGGDTSARLGILQIRAAEPLASLLEIPVIWSDE